MCLCCVAVCEATQWSNGALFWHSTQNLAILDNNSEEMLRKGQREIHCDVKPLFSQNFTLLMGTV